MAYYSSTEASSVANPPVLIAGSLARTKTNAAYGIGSQGGIAVWAYGSTNAAATVSAANFITDGYYLGMRPGDLVLGVYQSSLNSTDVSSYRLVVSSVSTDGVYFSTGQMSTS